MQECERDPRIAQKITGFPLDLENLEKWGYTWKNHGILSFRKSGNPEDYLHNIQWSWYYFVSFDINFFSKSFFNFFTILDTVKISAWTCSTNRKYFFRFFSPFSFQWTFLPIIQTIYVYNKFLLHLFTLSFLDSRGIPYFIFIFIFLFMVVFPDVFLKITVMTRSDGIHQFWLQHELWLMFF